jgi:hypothetical protein
MVVITGDDGHEYDNMLCIHGEVPPQRYQGIHRSKGPQYVRGIVEGNGDPPGKHLWNVYSVNKEDIWVSRTHVPVMGKVAKHVSEDFEKARSESDLELWNLYVPKWAPISVVSEAGNRCLELRDAEPYDQAVAERAIPPSKVVTIAFRVKLAELPRGRILEFEVQGCHGERPMRLRFDNRWLYVDREQMSVDPLAIETGKWYDVELKLDCSSQRYALTVNGKIVYEAIEFGVKADSLERMVWRTGPYRNDVRASIVDGESRPSGLYSEDLPAAGEKIPVSVFLIDDVRTK